MDNQTIVPPNPSSDFLNRMDMANNPNPTPEPPKKKLSKPAIIGIILGAIALIGIIVAVTIILNSNQAQPSPTISVTEYPDDDEEELDEEVIERNELRKNDLAPLITATLDFQNSNNGALPGDYVSQWKWLLNTYIPDGLKDMATGESYEIKEVCKFSESCIELSELTWEENAHEIYIYLNAACKGDTKDNLIVSFTGRNKAAIFTILEGSKTFLCSNN